MDASANANTGTGEHGQSPETRGHRKRVLQGWALLDTVLSDEIGRSFATVLSKLVMCQ